jgi:protein SCO1/2
MRRLVSMIVIGLVAMLSAPAMADPGAGTNAGTYSLVPETPPDNFDVGVDEKLDAPVPMDAIFKDENGKMVRLGDFIDGKRPTVLVLASQTCKTLCTFVQRAVLDASKGIDWSVGTQYDVVTVSIHPGDTPAMALAKKNETVTSYAREGAAKGWHFLTGDAASSQRVADAVGWKFHRDIDGDIAHPAAVMLLKPNGHVARYIYGIELAPTDLSVGLLEASEGKNITTFEHIKLYCYHYDPHQRKYALLATHVMQVGGGLTLLLLAGFIGVMVARERKKKDPPSGPPSADHQAVKPA